MRVAAIDCGTNSVRLLIADLDGGRLVERHREMRIVRLGQDVDRTGELSPQALARTGEALRAYAGTIAQHQVVATRMVATSATRDARNRDAFEQLVQSTVGVTPEVITGEQEAALSFDGAVRDLDRAAGPFLVVDIGGGSTEFVLGTSAVDAACSVDIGCVRLTERHLAGDPPTADEIRAAVADIDAALARVGDLVPVKQAKTVVGLAGSVTTIAALALNLPAYDSTLIHHSRLGAADVRRVRDQLLAMTRVERAALPVMHPGRVDVIGAGAQILATIVDRLGLAEVLVSETDILDGIAWSLAR